jgi:hypothetical protein
MKGIVVDINNKNAVVLSDDGIFQKVRNRNYEIGQTLQIGESGNNGLKPALERWLAAGPKLSAGAASIAAVLTIGTIGAFAWYTPTDYISLDVNPSIEYSVNMFERILKVHAVNEDGEEILSNLQLKNKNIGEGLKATLDELIAEGYLADDPDSGVVIATSNDKQTEAEKMAKELKQEVQTYLDAREDVAAKVDVGAASPEKVREAKDMGVTPGKLHLVEKLQASTTGAIDMQQWLTKPVKDINKEIKKNWETEGWNPYNPAQAAYNPYWNWTQDQAGGQSQSQTQSQDKYQNQNWGQFWTPQGTANAGVGNGGNSSGKENSSGRNSAENQNQQNQNQNWNWDWNQYWPQTANSGQPAAATAPAINPYQSWSWSQYWAKPGGTSGSSNSKENNGVGSGNKENSSSGENSNSSGSKAPSGNSGAAGSDENKGQNQDQSQTQSWNQSWPQSAAQGQTNATAPAINPYQNQGWSQYWVQPGGTGTAGGSSDKDSKDNNNANNTNKGNNNKDTDTNKDADTDKDNNSTGGGVSSGQSRDQNRNQSWPQTSGPGQTVATAPAINPYQSPFQNWNNSRNADQSESKNQDQSQNQNQTQSQSQNQKSNKNWSQSWSRNWTLTQPAIQSQNQNQNWAPPGSRNQITPGGIGTDYDKSAGKKRNSKNDD